MRRSLKYLGATLVIVGILMSAMPTTSFGTIAGERGVDVSIADEGGLIAISDTGAEVTQPGKGATVARVENNLESTATIEYEASVSSPSLRVKNPSGIESVQPGGSIPIQVSCAPPKAGAGTATLTIDIIRAEGESAAVTDATLETTVEYDCPGRTGSEKGPKDPGAPPGDAFAYVDDNRNLAYDDGERIVPKDELATFDNDSAHLVIAAGGETIQYNNQKVEIGAKTITVDETTLSSKKEIKMEAEGEELSLRDSTIDSQNGKIELKAKEVTAGETTVSSNAELKLTAESGTLTFSDSTADSRNGKIEFKGRSIDAPRSTYTSNQGIKLEAEGGSLSLSDATVDSTNGKVELKAGSISADGASITSNDEIKLTAESGPLELGDATVESANSKIEIKSGSQLSASGTSFESNAEIKLTSSGDMTLDNAEIRSVNGQATLTLNRESATLAVDGAVLRDADSTVVYSPSGATVTGTPSEGSLEAG